MIAEALVMIFGFLMYFVPFACACVCTFIFFKRLGGKILNLIPTKGERLPFMAPVVQKIVIRKRVIDLKNKLATEVSLEATPEQVRSIFKRDYSS